MLADSSQNISSGMLTEGIELDSSIKSVIEFIEIHFSNFSQKVKGEISSSEKALTDKLCKFLNRNSSTYPFFFHHENVENHASGMSPQTNIGMLSESERLIIGDRSYGEFDSFFSIEAKRLPTQDKIVRKNMLWDIKNQVEELNDSKKEFTAKI